jgi:RNA polymerase sigma factor (sigma-70 family)
MTSVAAEQPALPHRAIEKAYKERRSGFLAWARKHAPDEGTAEDVLQDAFVRAVASANAFSLVEDAAAWIFSTLRNRLTDLWRGESARQRAGAVDLPQETLEKIVAAAGFDPQEALLRGELVEALDTAIEALPAEQREVLLAQTVEGTTFAALAERTGISIDTLMARKRRAVHKLAAALEYWIDEG